MSESQAPSSLPWSQALILLCPTIALLIAVFLVGVETWLGFALLSAAQIYLVVDLAFIMPWMAGQHSARYAAVPEMMNWYMRQLASCNRVADLGNLIAHGNHLISGSERAILFLTIDGEVQVHGGDQRDHQLIGYARDSVTWLASQRQVIFRSELDDHSEPAALLDQLKCQVVLPLHDGDTAVGAVVARADLSRVDAATRQAYRWLRGVTSTALARIALDFDMPRALELVGIVDYARATQQALMPDDRTIQTEGFQLRGISQPAAQCGGDLWAWRSLGEGRILVVIGDVTGHGVVPAVISATAAGAIHATALAEGSALDPGVLLSEVNRSLYRVAGTSYMMTALAIIADYGAGEIYYANAAQNFPYLITPAAGPDEKPGLEVLVARGPMLGSSPEVHFECHRRPLMPGQKLFLYSDGIVEAQLAKNHVFGERRLRRKLRELADADAETVATSLFTAVQQFLMGRPWTDDITIVVVERPVGRLG